MSDFDDFDCIQPTLIQQIKRILDQYPDDGQILKELIQNAEDAEAKEVKFLYDHHSHGTEELHTPGLAKFQGPALYAYNDAEFSTNDWKGVRMLSDSIKEKDPTKVGRFGLGFKSVFHMTDLPSVISGDSVAIIDPEEKYFSDNNGKRSGRKWHLKNHQKNMQSIPDHFVPYKGIFGCDDDSFEQGSYEGTLFRLPLRKEASQVSETIYSPEKMKGLFECFEKDGHLILLFLMSLERIEVYEREVHCSQPRKLFHVGISDHCLADVRKAREEFKTKVQENVSPLSDGSFSEVKKTFNLTIETVHCSNGVGSKAEQHSFVVTNFFSGNDVSVTMKELILDATLSYMPWIGVALPVATQLKMEEDIDDMKEPQEPQGHLFCFLPLPLESKSLTGLPVHVNGFFALSQNRRHLKWPSADQDETIQTDKSLLWNKGLLQEVLPKAYAELILHVISCLSEDEPRQTVTTSDAYQAWPDINKVDVKWRGILLPLFDILLQSEVLYTDADGGGWYKLEEIVLDSLKKSDQSRKIVIELLNKTGQKVVTVPAHVNSALQRFRDSYSVRYITPKILRTSLKAHPSCYSDLNHQDKILLLKFVLSDSVFTELEGLQLLPLSDKTFATFGRRRDDPIYIDSAEHPKSLLPGLQRMFLDTESDDVVTEQLKKAAEEDHTQLCHFNKEAVKRHIRQTLPSDWLVSEDHVTWRPGKPNQPTIEWLKELWEYFGRHFAHTASDLDGFINLPLVPVTPISNNSDVQLARIQRPSSLVLASFNGENIDESVCQVLRAVGLTILTDVPEYVRHYPELVPSYANPASPRGVLNAMEVIFESLQKKNDLLQKTTRLPADKIRLFRTFLSSLPSLTPNGESLLRQLPLFETFVGSGGRQSRFVSINEVKFAAPVEDLPDVAVYTDLLDLRDDSSRALAQMLNTSPMKLVDLLKTLLDDALQNKYDRDEREIDILAKYTLERIGIFHGLGLETIKQKLQCLSFVVCGDNLRKKPTELFNPEDALLRKVFLGEDVFPKDSYYAQPEVNAHLKKLGLKGEERITESEVLNSANMVNKMEDVDEALAKSLGLLELLGNNPLLLQAAGNRLRSTTWVPVLRTKPDTYPTYLPLEGRQSGAFACPNDLKTQKFANIIGSVKLVVGMASSPNVSEYFGWRQNPCASDVLMHLRNVVLSYHVADKSSFIGAVKEIYRYIHDNINPTDVTDGMRELQLTEWVWNGDGFSSLSEVVLENRLLNLIPYVSELPKETQEFSSLFISFGMKESCDTDLLLNVLFKIREKHELKNIPDLSEVKRDLQLSIDILNELKPKNGEPFDTNVREKLLVPVHVSENEAKLEMKPVEECTYCDREWLKQGHDASDIHDQDEVKIKFIHRNIPDTTAELLGVPTLMSRILGAEELELGESFGQSESLLDRIRGLLDGYTDGLSVPKELIQNADDAGATEVRFLYDERTNEDCMTRLIDEGMKECQGPALWAYNDAVFSDEDFQNIVKLNAATKKEDSRKIGRFGLGFNSVYNLTDVPSFVSRNSIVILDPHTTYLGKGIRDKSKPGIKLRIEEKKLRRLQNQFKPYNGIFGCNLRPGAQQSYNGTLFRFPLRTANQALKSEIKNLHYDENQVKELLEILFHGAESLLLFTQNVLRVTVYHLSNKSTESPQPVELFCISKSCSKVVHKLQSEVSLSNAVQQLGEENQEFVKQSSVLKVSSSFIEEQKKKNFSAQSSPGGIMMKSSMIINCQCTLSDYGLRYLPDISASGGTTVSWMVTSCMVNGRAFEMAARNKGLLPTAGVAAKLTDVHSGNLKPVPITKPLDHKDNYQDSTPCLNGSVFCFLPLPIHSGLPVHINGGFAVSDNRRYLRERTEEDKTDQGAKWNDILMREVVCQTYISMLEDIKHLSSNNGYKFHSLWPTCSDLHANCHGMATQFYSSLFLEQPQLFSDGHTWTSVQNVVFLEPEFRDEGPIGQVALDVFKNSLEGTNIIVVDLSEEIFKSFERYEKRNEIQKMCYNKERFFTEVFFPAIDSIPACSRDKLVLYALDDTSEVLRELVRHHRCIPSSSFGRELKYPKELLHPTGKAAQLYIPEDGRFPHGNEFASEERLVKLKRLGMRDDDLEWDEVIERAESVKSLSEKSYHQALERTKLIVAFINRKLENEDRVVEDVQTRMQQVQFLPIMKKPENFPFKWKGDEYPPGNFLSAAELFPKAVKYLASASVPILDETKDGCIHLPPKVKRFLLMAKTSSLDHVKKQMESVIETAKAMFLESSCTSDEVKKAFETLYDYFQRKLETEKAEVVKFLKPLTFILGEKKLFSTNNVAFQSQVDYPPYLSAVLLSSELKYRQLLKSVGVRESFDIGDYITTLRMVKEKHDKNPVIEELIKVTDVLKLLADTMEKEKVTAVEAIKKYGTIFLPDSKGVMKPSRDVCVKDCFWMPDEEGVIYANKDLLPHVCLKLGANTRRQETLRKHTLGLPFGQKEKLTNRLKRILTGYPCGESIMKELLQNADDAKATKVCFIKDPRQHPDEKVFEECWKPLQGPALCVYNNAPFTKSDIEGIQNLGEGNKGDDPNKTGQYGVGFNAVYHLTDAPTFISRGKEIGEVMCVFDPNLKFAPGADESSPGVMYENVSYLKEIFTDVFPCYLGEHFPIDNGTMFRFPLRDEEMANDSKICKTPMTTEGLDKVIDSFKEEMLEVLLFVNNVREISVCEVGKEAGNMIENYSVKASLSKEDEEKRRDFAAHVSKIGKLLQSGKMSISDVPVHQVSYVVNLEDSKGLNQKWFVVQKIGFENPKDIPGTVIKAFNKGDLGLLPRGGVASLLSPSENLKGKAFCFLPLPFETGLPVHINGHFALDHEARRNLWRDDKGDYRGSWNDALLRQVVAPCYVSLLDEVRDLISLPVNGNRTNLSCSRDDAEQILNSSYACLFPSLSTRDAYWQTLSKEVYRYMDGKRIRLLPVLREDQHQPRVFIEWLPPKGEGRDQAFFGTLIENLPKQLDYDTFDKNPKERTKKRCRSLQDTLLAVGFNLLCMPMRVYECFEKSNVDVSLVSPTDVISFFGTYKTPNQLCNIGCLPLDIKDTPFESVDKLLVVLKYCDKEKTFCQGLDGLPLLLTQDGILRVLSRADPVFQSGYCDILPHCSSMFVHREMFNSVFHLKDGHTTSPVFKEFDINAFANLLPTELKEEQYKSTDRYVIWNPNTEHGQDNIPNKNWISHVWRFFSNCVEKLVDEHVKERRRNMANEIPKGSIVDEICLNEEIERKRIAQEALLPVNEWCLLPATETEKEGYRITEVRHFLVPLVLAKSVINFRSFGLSESSLKINLEKMGLPELNCRILEGGLYSASYSKTARQLVTGSDDPTSILTVLVQKLKRDPKALHDLGKDTYERVLCFFNEHVKLFSSGDSEDLKALPFYTTIHGESISIKDMQAIVLSDSIPKDDMHIWQEKSMRIAFLKEDDRLKKLYAFLGCDSKNAIDLYCDIIFEKFHEMSEEARLEHLKFLRRLLMGLNDFMSYPRDDVRSKDEEKLLQELRKLKFIPDRSGSFKTARSFYDPSNEVFEVMFETKPDIFPPKPFCDVKWLPFLRRIGLIHKVSNEQFVKFAIEVEAEAKTMPSEATSLRNKSETLVNHLFKRENVATNELLDDVKEICFIFPLSVKMSLQRLHKQYGTNESYLPYICFKDSVASYDHHLCWTSANLLPYDANPLHCRDINHNYKGKSMLNSPRHYRERIFHRLGILESPTVDMVVSHCKTVCKVLSQKKSAINKNKNDCLEESDLVLEIMTSIYRYLKSNYHRNEEVISELKNIRCIAVDYGKRFVFPNQVAVDITSEQEIPPYLYKIPLEIGAFGELFRNLGATDTVTAAQYSMVLKNIHDETGDEKLHPNEIRDAFKATKGLFETIGKMKVVVQAQEISPLYLPGEKRNPEDAHQPFVFLQRSNGLVFNDAPNFKERIKCFERLLLVKLEKCDLEVSNDDLLLKKLPESVRPLMLTSVVHETLVEENRALVSNTAQELREILTSGEFCHGLIRMIRHSHYESEVDISSDVLINVRRNLSCIYVFGVSHLRTRLMYNGKAIPESEANVSCFGEKEEIGGVETLKIYVEEGANLKKYFSRVAIIVDRMTGSLLGKEGLTHLSTMLSLMASEIKGFLDDLGVREDNSFLDAKSSYLPPAGNFIHIDDHHLLVDAFVVFRPGDYVGYELDDPSLRGEDGTPTYIYAIVIEEVFEDGQPSSTAASSRRYRINIGKDKEPIIVDAADLYMFKRPDKLSNEHLELKVYCGPCSDKSKQTETLGEVLKRITQILEEAWSLPEEKRHKIIKRLFLTWHPDKNPGNEEFCTKVFQFIQGKIERLEKGGSVKRPWRGSDYSYDGFYGSFFNRWSSRAGYHRGQSSSFYRGGGFSTFSRGSYRSNPQPGEARRWYNQAKADLEAASNDVDYQRTSYEWACFKCHQSAEKALKAAQYSKDADKTSTHSLTALAQELSSDTLLSLASQLECLVGNSMRMRYPDQVGPPNIPHDVYDRETALRAMEITSNIAQEVKSGFLSAI